MFFFSTRKFVGKGGLDSLENFGDWLDIDWADPLPSNTSHQQDNIYIFRFWHPELNLHVPLGKSKKQPTNN